jgi:hypothetical protein
MVGPGKRCLGQLNMPSGPIQFHRSALESSFDREGAMMSDSSISKPCEHDVGDPELNERMLGGCRDEKADLYCAGRRKLYIWMVVSEVDEAAGGERTLHSLHLPPTASQRPRQPRG